jgi:hypothetical protein
MGEIVIDTRWEVIASSRIGAVELVNGPLTDQTFHCYLCPQRSVPADALAVHGLSAEFWRGASIPVDYPMFTRYSINSLPSCGYRDCLGAHDGGRHEGGDTTKNKRPEMSSPTLGDLVKALLDSHIFRQQSEKIDMNRTKTICRR